MKKLLYFIFVLLFSCNQEAQSPARGNQPKQSSAPSTAPSTGPEAGPEERQDPITPIVNDILKKQYFVGTTLSEGKGCGIRFEFLKDQRIRVQFSLWHKEKFYLTAMDEQSQRLETAKNDKKHYLILNGHWHQDHFHPDRAVFREFHIDHYHNSLCEQMFEATPEQYSELIDDDHDHGDDHDHHHD